MLPPSLYEQVIHTALSRWSQPVPSRGQRVPDSAGPACSGESFEEDETACSGIRPPCTEILACAAGFTPTCGYDPGSIPLSKFPHAFAH